MSHGFRVYSVELVKQMGWKPIEDWTVAGAHYLTYVQSLACELAADQFLLVADPKWSVVQNLSKIDEVPTTRHGERYVRWLSSHADGRRVSFEVRYGILGNYSDAMGIGGDTPIADKAPGRRYRAVILLPEHEGVGLLAVETINRAVPLDPLLKWLGGTSVVREKGGVWWRLNARQLADSAYLTELIGRAEKAEVTLKHVGVDEVGDRARTQYRLTAPLGHRQRSRAVEWISSLMGKNRSLEGMLEIVGVANTGDLKFTEGYIDLDDGESKTKIGLSDAREIFTYPISQDRPDDDAWLAAVRHRFGVLIPALSWE